MEKSALWSLWKENQKSKTCLLSCVQRPNIYFIPCLMAIVSGSITHLVLQSSDWHSFVLIWHRSLYQLLPHSALVPPASQPAHAEVQLSPNLRHDSITHIYPHHLFKNLQGAGQSTLLHKGPGRWANRTHGISTLSHLKVKTLPLSHLLLIKNMSFAQHGFEVSG